MEPYRELCPRTIPPFPKLPTVRIPQPAKILAESSDADMVLMLATSYRDSLRMYDAKNRNAYFANVRDPATHKDYGRLVSAGNFMRGSDIPPLAWCSFSVMVWRRHKTGLPSTSFVFSGSRLVERYSWFLEYSDGFVPPSLMVVPEHTDLIERYRDMEGTILRLKPHTAPQVRDVVEFYFPGTKYEDALSAALHAVRRHQQYVDQLVAMGGSPWLTR